MSQKQYNYSNYRVRPLGLTEGSVGTISRNKTLKDFYSKNSSSIKMIEGLLNES